jgi:hypothetical protein
MIAVARFDREAKLLPPQAPTCVRSGDELARSKNAAFGQNLGGTSAPPASSQRRHSWELRQSRHRRLAAANAIPRPSRAAAPGSTATRRITSPMSCACRSTRAAIGHAAAFASRRLDIPQVMDRILA